MFNGTHHTPADSLHKRQKYIFFHLVNDVMGAMCVWAHFSWSEMELNSAPVKYGLLPWCVHPLLLYCLVPPAGRNMETKSDTRSLSTHLYHLRKIWWGFWNRSNLTSPLGDDIKTDFLILCVALRSRALYCVTCHQQDLLGCCLNEISVKKWNFLWVHFILRSCEKHDLLHLIFFQSGIWWLWTIKWKRLSRCRHWGTGTKGNTITIT